MLDAFPATLKAAIGKKAVNYNSRFTDFTPQYLKTTYDKLWLLSVNEVTESSVDTDLVLSPPEAQEIYEYFEGADEKVSRGENPFMGAYTSKHKTESSEGYVYKGFQQKAF